MAGVGPAGYVPGMYRIFLLLAVLLAAGCASTRADATNWTDDRAVQQRLQARVGELMKAGGAAKPSELRAQLARKQAEVRLPAARTGTVSAEDLYARCADSVVIMAGGFRCKHCDQWHLSLAGAFAVGDGDVFATNFHVVNDTNMAILVAMSRDGRIAPVSEVLAANRDNDCALVRIPGLGLDPLPLHPGADPGAALHCISHPNQRFYCYSEGRVSRRFKERVRKSSSQARWLQVTADFGKGSSGCPLLDDAGNVVSMVASTRAVYHDPDDFRTAQMVFRDTVPAEVLLELVKSPAPAR